MTALLAAAHVWLPILIAVLASVVTGLSNYPRGEGAVAVLRRVLSLLSLVQHYDSPGSLKLPFLLPESPPVVGTTLKPAPRGFVPLLLVLVIAGGVAVAGLIVALVATGHSKQAVACLQSEEAPVIATVWQIVDSGGVNWASDLETLAGQIGLPLVKCCLAAIETSGGHLPAFALVPRGAALPVEHQDLVLANARSWLVSH